MITMSHMSCTKNKWQTRGWQFNKMQIGWISLMIYKVLEQSWKYSSQQKGSLSCKEIAEWCSEENEGELLEQMESGLCLLLYSVCPMVKPGGLMWKETQERERKKKFPPQIQEGWENVVFITLSAPTPCWTVRALFQLRGTYFFVWNIFQIYNQEFKPLFC